MQGDYGSSVRKITKPLKLFQTENVNLFKVFVVNCKKKGRDWRNTAHLLPIHLPSFSILVLVSCFAFPCKSATQNLGRLVIQPCSQKHVPKKSNFDPFKAFRVLKREHGENRMRICSKHYMLCITLTYSNTSPKPQICCNGPPLWPRFTHLSTWLSSTKHTDSCYFQRTILNDTMSPSIFLWCHCV